MSVHPFVFVERFATLGFANSFFYPLSPLYFEVGSKSDHNKNVGDSVLVDVAVCTVISAKSSGV